MYELTHLVPRGSENQEVTIFKGESLEEVASRASWAHLEPTVHGPNKECWSVHAYPDGEVRVEPKGAFYRAIRDGEREGSLDPRLVRPASARC